MPKTRNQGFASGALSAVLVALFPTSTADIKLDSSSIHYAAAFVLFSVLAFFCYVFWKETKDGTAVEQRRRPVYFVCGVVMVASMVVIAIAKTVGIAEEVGITFWGEAIALTAFGVAWIVSGKALPFLSDAEERPELYSDIARRLKKMISAGNT